MASPAVRVSLRLAVAVAVILVALYVGRPLYWKISATIQDIRENRRTVREGISQIVKEAQKSVAGWHHDELDSGSIGDRREGKTAAAAAIATSRRFLLRR